jgi:hypothetical protein
MNKNPINDSLSMIDVYNNSVSAELRAGPSKNSALAKGLAKLNFTAFKKKKN